MLLILKMSASLFALNDELSFPGARYINLAVKKRGLKVTQEQAKLISERNPGNQVIAPLQPSRGKTAAENLDARWQADLAEVANDNKKGDARFFFERGQYLR